MRSPGNQYGHDRMQGHEAKTNPRPERNERTAYKVFCKEHRNWNQATCFSTIYPQTSTISTYKRNDMSPSEERIKDCGYKYSEHTVNANSQYSTHYLNISNVKVRNPLREDRKEFQANCYKGEWTEAEKEKRDHRFSSPPILIPNPQFLKDLKMCGEESINDQMKYSRPGKQSKSTTPRPPLQEHGKDWFNPYEQTTTHQ